MPGIGIQRAGAQANPAGRLADCRQVGDRVALEIAVVHPDGLEPAGFGLLRPLGDVSDIAAGGESQPHRACQVGHAGITVLLRPGGRNRGST